MTALARLAEAPSSESGRLAQLLELGPPADKGEYADLFSFQLYPYASVYLGAEGMMGGEARDRITGFWRALDLEPPPEPDHLATLLAFYAELSAATGRINDRRSSLATERARVAFLHEHLLSWLPVYLAKLELLTAGFYHRWARLLAATLETETSRAPVPDRLSLHLREAPRLPAPQNVGGEAFLESLLAPVRTGFLLVRSDLTRAGQDLGLGVRAGERKFALKALLAQDAASTLDWLRQEALGQARSHAASTVLPATARDFWRARAETAAKILESARNTL